MRQKSGVWINFVRQKCLVRQLCRTFVELTLGSTRGAPSESVVAPVSFQRRLIQLSSAHEKYGFRTRPNYIIHNHVLYHCFQGYNKPNAYIATQGMWKRSLYLLSHLYNVTKIYFFVQWSLTSPVFKNLASIGSLKVNPELYTFGLMNRRFSRQGVLKNLYCSKSSVIVIPKTFSSELSL